MIGRLLGVLAIVWAFGGVWAFGWMADGGAKNMHVPLLIEIWGWSICVVVILGIIAALLGYLYQIVKWIIVGDF